MALTRLLGTLEALPYSLTPPRRVELWGDMMIVEYAGFQDCSVPECPRSYRPLRIELSVSCCDDEWHLIAQSFRRTDSRDPCGKKPPRPWKGQQIQSWRPNGVQRAEIRSVYCDTAKFITLAEWRQELSALQEAAQFINRDGFPMSGTAFWSFVPETICIPPNEDEEEEEEDDDGCPPGTYPTVIQGIQVCFPDGNNVFELPSVPSGLDLRWGYRRRIKERCTGVTNYLCNQATNLVTLSDRVYTSVPTSRPVIWTPFSRNTIVVEQGIVTNYYNTQQLIWYDTDGKVITFASVQAELARPYGVWNRGRIVIETQLFVYNRTNNNIVWEGGWIAAEGDPLPNPPDTPPKECRLNQNIYSFALYKLGVMQLVVKVAAPPLCEEGPSADIEALMEPLRQIADMVSPIGVESNDLGPCPC